MGRTGESGRTEAVLRPIMTVVQYGQRA